MENKNSTGHKGGGKAVSAKEPENTARVMYVSVPKKIVCLGLFHGAILTLAFWIVWLLASRQWSAVSAACMAAAGLAAGEAIAFMYHAGRMVGFDGQKGAVIVRRRSGRERDITLSGLTDGAVTLSAPRRSCAYGTLPACHGPFMPVRGMRVRADGKITRVNMNALSEEGFFSACHGARTAVMHNRTRDGATDGPRGILPEPGAPGGPDGAEDAAPRMKTEAGKAEGAGTRED